MRALSRCLVGPLPKNDDLLRIRQASVAGPSGAMVLPGELYPSLEAIEPELNERGLRILDPPFVVIDPRAGEIVLRDPAVDALGGSVDALGDSIDPPVGEGDRLPIVEWAILRRDDGNPIRLQDTLATLVSHVEGIPSNAIANAIGESRAIGDLARVLSMIRVSAIWFQGRTLLLDRLFRAR
jgi:hypothetical protein